MPNRAKDVIHNLPAGGREEPWRAKDIFHDLPANEREKQWGMKDYFRYLPASEREAQWGLYVTAGGFNAIAPGDPYPRPGHPRGYAFSINQGRSLQEFQALYITRGEGRFESEPTGLKRVAAGSVVLLFPGIWHRYRPDPNVGWDEYWISFNGPFAERWAAGGFVSAETPVLKTGLDYTLLHAYVTLLDRLRSEPLGFQQLLAASAMEILAAALGAARGQGTGSRMHELVCQAKSLLETQVGAIPSMKKLAASLGLSATHFHRVFRAHTGLSPYQYHLQLRIERAKQMLHGTRLSVKEIANSLAFESPFHFSNVFRRKTGMSPSKWRN
jgi:AraC-like DNA-binding protein